MSSRRPTAAVAVCGEVAMIREAAREAMRAVLPKVRSGRCLAKSAEMHWATAVMANGGREQGQPCVVVEHG
ncbi:hypothetical protein ABZX40_41120 [Streptomyces sp. NPDC004610]|uniref:hypothetical protein n=1 Tax=unclassified Streptomyces TaxID=2593676 RepID=UPI0033BE97A2